MDQAQPNKTQFSIEELIELLELPQDKVMQLASDLGLKLNQDFSTQSIWFSEQDYQLMKRYKNKRSSLLASVKIEETVAESDPLEKSETTFLKSNVSTNRVAKGAKSPMVSISTKLVEKALTANAIDNPELIMAVDAVSRLKESLMNDFSTVLEQKLGGLDDLIIELIRARCELEQLKEEVLAAQTTVQNLKHELDLYEPAAFGFWRKKNQK